MRHVYLSHFLGPDTPYYGGDGSFLIEPLRSIASGAACNSSKWSLPNHAGTHIDLPRHFINEGKCINEYPADFWLFKNIGVIDISDILPAFVIYPEKLEKSNVDKDVELLLLKTGFGRYRATSAYWQKNPVFRPELAEYLRDKFPSLRAFGFDTISISSWTDRTTGREAHRAFLGGHKPILLVEDMNLSSIASDTILSCVTVAPLLVNGADASPCTVIAEVIE